MCINAHPCTALQFMKETEVLHLSRRWNLEKWKRCICILICPQSGIVFGVAGKFPDVCSSSLFIGTPWETGLKFKCACYHSIWRWVFSSFPVCLLLPFLCHSFLSSLLFYVSIFFTDQSPFFIIAPHFFAVHPSPRSSSRHPFLIVGTMNAYISLVVPTPAQPCLIGSIFFSPHLTSILPALPPSPRCAFYNIAIRGMWKRPCAPESRAV